MMSLIFTGIGASLVTVSIFFFCFPRSWVAVTRSFDDLAASCPSLFSSLFSQQIREL